jgi:hypothetical protein|tara:strand:+ start:26 stop:244 length:219 start_codon:yes stop_codon:yes gene_type:complete
MNHDIIYVESSAINNARYDHNSERLIVRFNNESSYQYKDVPLFYWRGLQNSSSKGKFINNFIVKKFSFDKLS